MRVLPAGEADMFERQVLSYLERVKQRRRIPVQVALWDGRQVALHDKPAVEIRLKSPSAGRYLVSPSMGRLGEAYVEGHIDIDGRVRDMIRVAEALARDASGSAPANRAPWWPLRHTRRSDRQAIAYHYDVSNEFYARWLDPRMVYSCAYFRTGNEDLETAQIQKLDHICRKLLLSRDHTLLDIGCGWGALAIHAAQHYGARVTGITLSTNQLALARERVAAAGLTGRVQILLQDYRDVPGEAAFDRITSVGMFEHVGLKNLPEYFKTMHRLLKPGGVAMNHGITSSDPASRGVGMGVSDFVGRYVFPHGELPHASLAIHELAAAGLELTDAESLRRHYALTLSHWSDAFEQHLPELVELAGERRARIWRVYLAGCAHAFAQGWINIYQLLTVKPDAGRIPLPLTRDYMYERRG